MDLKLAYKWIQEYIKIDLRADEFARTLSIHGPSIERWHFNDDLQDYILSIEVTSNRADSASVIGIAREASAILRSELLLNKPDLNLTPSKSLPLSVNISNFERAPRFQSIVIDGVTVTESPEWMRKRLEASGINPINNIVDITNYVLLEYGQPMHAYDYEKIDGKEIHVRLANAGEKIKTLGTQVETELTTEDLVVADSKSPLSIAGVKGGEKSGITLSTTTIVLEAGNFEPTNIRKTARRHNLITNASALFEKGLPQQLTEDAMLRAIQLVLKLAGGEIASEIIDIKEIQPQEIAIKYPYSLTKRILGLEITKEEVVDILTRLGFVTDDAGEYLNVKVPFNRELDIKVDYDLTEEIARIYGYQNIPNILPETEIPGVSTPSIIINEDRIKDILVDNGFLEVFSYSLVSDKHLNLSEKNPGNAIQMLNPLTVDYLYMRTDLASNMLTVSEQNETFKNKLELFELSNVYLKTSDNDLPNEESRLSILINGTDYKQTFYEVKGMWELILKMMGVNLDDVEYRNEDISEPYFKGRSANIYYKNDLLGIIGVASKRAQKILGFKKENALLEINFVKLSQIFDKTIKSYKPIAKYPEVNRDLAFIIDKSIQWQEVKMIARSLSGRLLRNIELFDMFEDSKLGAGKKSIAFHMTFQSDEKTLVDEEVNALIQSIVNKIQSEFNALQRL